MLVAGENPPIPPPPPPPPFHSLLFVRNNFRLFLYFSLVCLCNRAARAVQRRQRPKAKEQWHYDMNPLDARSGLKECLIQKKNENLITNKTNDKTK